jgi:hypothetical protein
MVQSANAGEMVVNLGLGQLLTDQIEQGVWGDVLDIEHKPSQQGVSGKRGRGGIPAQSGEPPRGPGSPAGRTSPTYARPLIRSLTTLRTGNPGAGLIYAGQTGTCHAGGEPAAPDNPLGDVWQGSVDERSSEQPSRLRGNRMLHLSVSNELRDRSRKSGPTRDDPTLGDRRDERSLAMTERVPPEGPDGLPPADPTEEGLPEDEQGADQGSEEKTSEERDAERSLSNKLGAFGSGRSG